MAIEILNTLTPLTGSVDRIKKRRPIVSHNQEQLAERDMDNSGDLYPVVWIGYKKLLSIFAGVFVELSEDDVPDVHEPLVGFANYILPIMNGMKNPAEGGLPYCHFTEIQIRHLFHPEKLHHHIGYFSNGEYEKGFDLAIFSDELQQAVRKEGTPDPIVAPPRQLSSDDAPANKVRAKGTSVGHGSVELNPNKGI